MYIWYTIDNTLSNIPILDGFPLKYFMIFQYVEGGVPPFFRCFSLPIFWFKSQVVLVKSG